MNVCSFLVVSHPSQIFDLVQFIMPGYRELKASLSNHIRQPAMRNRLPAWSEKVQQPVFVKIVHLNAKIQNLLRALAYAHTHIHTQSH